MPSLKMGGHIFLCRDRLTAFAHSHIMHTQSGIKLLSVEEAKAVAAKQLGSENIRYKEVELEEESDDYPNAENFRPVYKIECYAERDEYDIVVDAVTGQVLKCKLDD